MGSISLDVVFRMIYTHRRGKKDHYIHRPNKLIPGKKEMFLFKILFILPGLRWKRMLLSNVDYLEEEIELRELIDYFVGKKKLTTEHKVYILKGHPRKERFKRFFSIIKDVFENSTYYDLKNQIDKQHEDILRDMDDNGCGKG